MPFGKQIGPTGRKRDEFLVFSQGRKQPGEKTPYLDKPYKGNMGRYAWGQVGVRELKQSVHHRYPHRWVKFIVHNESRFERRIAKRRKSK